MYNIKNLIQGHLYMNYQNYSNFDDTSIPRSSFYTENYDRGNGVPKITQNNTTVQDVFRTPFLFLQEHRKNYKNLVNTAVKGVQSTSDLSKLFFSDKNIKRIQKMIRKEISIRTKNQFRLDVDQDTNDLFICMRATYLQYARFLPGQTVRQCKRLNRKVVDETVPGIITNIKQYHGYIKDINKPISPIPRPQNVNNAGRLTLPSITSIWSV